MKHLTFDVAFSSLLIASLFAVTESSQISKVRQCTYQNLADDRDDGQILTCDFQKATSDTALRVTYQGDMRMTSCYDGHCCRRWFITINGHECFSPAPIDAVILEHLPIPDKALNLQRPATLDGFCYNIPRGRITVGLSVGNCKYVGQYWNGNALTCWNSNCRLIIEETPQLQ